jgi:hypothetical protein
MSFSTPNAPLKSSFTMQALESAWDVVKHEFAAACSHAARAARTQVSHGLNQYLRRLRQYQTEAEWVSAVLDGAAQFADEVALFSFDGAHFRLRGQRKLHLADNLSFPTSAAGAFLTAVDLKDPVIALRTATEVSPSLSTASPADRAHILPIINGPRAVAALFAADKEYMDVNALEVIAGMASAVLERHTNSALHAQILPATAPTHHAPAPSSPAEMPGAASKPPASATPAIAPAPRSLPSWADLNPKDRELHIRAQRFSRVAVAEMQLSRPEAARAGREQSNLYVFLKKEIDTSREAYRKQFLTIPTMVDYLHLELARTAAEGDELKLGADYPGPLV